MNDRPQWVTKYRLLGLPRGWADSALEKHTDKFISEVSSAVEPLENVTVDVTDMQAEPVSQFPQAPDQHTRIEVLILIIDLIERFSSHVPKRDRDIYDMYEQSVNSPLFSVGVDFPDFYKFARETQYTDITRINYYKLINQTFKNYVLRSADPERGSVWEIPYEDDIYKVKVKGKVPIVNEEIADPEIYCEVMSSKDEEDPTDDFASIPPIAFNDGRPIKKEI